jgi:glycosyltransferase A (GT-A) superfamily protein (DUF2064 family)
MPPPILAVMARVPVPGRAKTRLVPPLTPEQAAAGSAAFTRDVLAMAAASGLAEVRLALADWLASGPDIGPGPGADAAAAAGALHAAAAGEFAAAAAPLLEAAVALRVPVEDQGEGDLGCRMAMVLGRAHAAGRSGLLVGGDVPDLPPSLLAAAVRALGEADVVLVPARDGGYVLVGARRPVDGLFELDVPWGSSSVLEATRRSLVRRGASLRVLDAWEDVDDAAALGRLAARLEAAGPGLAPASADWLRGLVRDGVTF